MLLKQPNGELPVAVDRSRLLNWWQYQPVWSADDNIISCPQQMTISARVLSWWQYQLMCSADDNIISCAQLMIVSVRVLSWWQYQLVCSADDNISSCAQLMTTSARVLSWWQHQLVCSAGDNISSCAQLMTTSACVLSWWQHQLVCSADDNTSAVPHPIVPTAFLSSWSSLSSGSDYSSCWHLCIQDQQCQQCHGVAVTGTYAYRTSSASSARVWQSQALMHTGPAVPAVPGCGSHRHMHTGPGFLVGLPQFIQDFFLCCWILIISSIYIFYKNVYFFVCDFIPTHTSFNLPTHSPPSLSPLIHSSRHSDKHSKPDTPLRPLSTLFYPRHAPNALSKPLENCSFHFSPLLPCCISLLTLPTSSWWRAAPVRSILHDAQY